MNQDPLKASVPAREPTLPRPCLFARRGQGPDTKDNAAHRFLGGDADAEIGVRRNRLHRLERFLAPDEFEDLAHAPPHAGIGVSEPLDERLFGHRSHLFEASSTSTAIFLNPRPRWVRRRADL